MSVQYVCDINLSLVQKQTQLCPKVKRIITSELRLILFIRLVVLETLGGRCARSRNSLTQLRFLKQSEDVIGGFSYIWTETACLPWLTLFVTR